FSSSLFFVSSRIHRALHSFPTRRSSDLNGIEYGLLLFLVASGLTLVFGVLGVLNFAHGSFYMLGAYLAWWLSERTGSLLLAILLDRKSTRLNSSHVAISYAVFCLKKKTK